MRRVGLLPDVYGVAPLMKRGCFPAEETAGELHGTRSSSGLFPVSVVVREQAFGSLPDNNRAALV